MKTFNDVGLLFLRPFLQYMRNPMFLFVNIGSPIMYLVLFMPLLQKISGPGVDSDQIIQQFLPGILALLFVTAGLTSVYPTIFELKKGLIERLRVTPASRFALLMGPILMWNAWTLISGAVLVAMSVLFGFEVHILGLLVFALLLVMLLTIFAAWVTAIAIIMKGEITSISGAVGGLNLPILLTGGVMLPLSLAPDWLRGIAHANPLFYAVEAGRELAAGNIANQTVGLAFAVIVPLMLVTVWWSTKVYRKALA